MKLKRTITTMLGALAVAAGFSMFAAPAAQAATEGPFGGITCTDYTSPSATYPADGSHFKVCFTAGLNTQRRSAVFGAVQALPTNNGSGQARPRDLLQSKGVSYYYFKTRADMNAFMAGKFKNLNGTPKAQWQNTTAVCGHSAFEVFPFGQNITSSVFDECLIGGASVPNPDLGKVTTHESGHSFDYALAANKSSNRGSPPSTSVGYRNLQNWDLSEILSFAMCTLFQGTPSSYEIQLGASPGAVCTNGIVNPGYTDQIVTAKAKAPYFVNQSGNARFGELFAEQFSIIAGTLGGITTPKQFVTTDNIIKDGRFDCTYFVMQSYFATLLPPGPSNPNQSSFGTGKLQFQGCPNISEGDLL